MPLLDHFHPPLRGPCRWEGFHHAWATNIAQHLNREVLPAGFFADPEISLGPSLETANLHADILETSEVFEAAWQSRTQLAAIAYRPVRVQNQQRIEAWPEALSLGAVLPVLPLWLRLDLCLPLHLEKTYTLTCSGLRIPS